MRQPNRLLLLAVGLTFLAPVLAQIPSTDIFLMDVVAQDGDVGVDQVRRLTDRVGYDNQPKFLPDGRSIVYSSWRDTGTDIYRMDLATGETTVVTGTAEGEYSPTPIPGQNAISYVRDYGDLKQQLWSVNLDDGSFKLLLPDVNPVGYHAWNGSDELLLFVLGEPMTLQVARTGPGAGRHLADSPGRGLSRIPGRDRMSYVDKSAEPWWLTEIDIASGDRRPLVETPTDREDYAWAPDGSVWIADDSRLYRWHEGESAWTEVADLDSHGVRGITRVAFSPDGDRLVVVGARTPEDLAAAYSEPAGRIIGAALTDTEGWKNLDHLATVIGHRLSGSEQLADAITWAATQMESRGLSVRLQPVMVPHWVRGEESARVVTPRPRALPMLGLGMSVGTPEGGITAPVVVVESFEELEAMNPEEIEGKIVVYAVEWIGYGGTVAYRTHGASRAAALGAAAVLVRSATSRSLVTPHTGALRYDGEQPRIPAAAITVEDAEWFKRMKALGQTMTVELKMAARTLPDTESHNVIVEIPGAERPEEVVVMGGHYDSWDVGEGVHDDGAACVAAWQALQIIEDLGLRPRRTLRVVLWTNEENGLRGAKAYREALSDAQLANHVAAIEMDGGNESPVGFGLGLHGVDHKAETPDPEYERALATMEQVVGLLAAIDADRMSRGGGGADISPLTKEGVPGMGLRTVGEHYFDWHHTHADTLDKLDPQNFRKAIALLAVTGYVLADMPERLVDRR
ncbi:MAG: M20/M25/M40 family metallo-hydrolase [Acidobacteriota bacterium]|nr:M20/M25/M40 family metallo-hydrolase [Acidobacteriota bacterium]